MSVDLAINVLKNQPVRLSKAKSNILKGESLLIEFIDKDVEKMYASMKIYPIPVEKRNHSIGAFIVKINSDYMYTTMYYEFLRSIDAIQSIRDVVDNRLLYENFTNILK